MVKTVQGDILRISGISWPVIVVSNDRFNEIGEVVVCPILGNITQNALHLPIRIPAPSGEITGLIACEHVKHVDLKARRFVKLYSLNLSQFLDISDTLIALFDFR